ncbi:MFS transporter [Mycobacteroides salmoniphilum]|uniref:MFS transporter n=1 Tax=Mycobacteroides salmoniphilum TaxID=404941 RepID=UPI001AD835E6|nr:MFS transporter [Mycobacteroides salmoniphilum]
MIRNLAFLRLWVGTTASGLATWVLPLVLGFAVLDGTLSATALGVLLAARTVGFLAAVPLGGVLADRYSRRSVVTVSSLLAATGHAAMAAGIHHSLGLSIAAAILAGAGQGACRPSYQALTAEVVTASQRQQANAAITIGVRVVTLVAPAVAALAASRLGVTPVLVALAGVWCLSAAAPPMGSMQPVSEGARFKVLSDFVEGFQEARRHPWFLAGLGALTAVIATGYSVTGVALPLVSRDRYGGEVVLASATTGYVAGALVGAVIIGRWRPRNQGWAALAGLACYTLAPLSLMFSVPAFVVIAAYVVTGLGIELFNVPWFTATQREVDPNKLARVSSLDFLLSYGLAPLGLAIIAPAMDRFGNTPILALCAVVCLVAPTAAAITPTARHFHQVPRAA